MKQSNAPTRNGVRPYSLIGFRRSNISSEPPMSGPTSRPVLPADCITPRARPCQVAIDHLRRQSTEGRAGETAAGRESGGDQQENREVIAQRQERERERGQDQAGPRQRYFAEYFDQPPDQPTLHDDCDDADESEEIPISVGVIAESLFREEREERRHDREAGDEKKISGHHDRKHPAVPVPENFGDGRVFMRSGAMLMRKALGQDQINEHRIRDGEPRREIKRRAVGNAAHDSADHRTECETETERGADHSHRLGSILGSGHVRDVGLRDRDVAAGDAGQNARDEKKRQRRRHSHEGKPDCGARDAYHQDGSPAEAIGKFPKDRREDNLHAGINPGEPADRDRSGVELLRVEGQDRNDNAEADQIDKDGEEEDEEW